MSKELILVTGGTGYIGSHAAVELLEEGFEVVIFDNLSNSKIEVLDGIKKITGKKPYFQNIDLCDKTKLVKYFRQYPIKAVIHFAAYKAVGESVSNPLLYYKNNITSLIHVLEMMQHQAIQQLVFSSSCTVYGQPDVLPVTESAPIKKALSPYGNTKRISEEIISDFAGIASLKSIILRYFNPIGAHPSGLIGELPLNVPNNLVPYITQTAAGVREQLKVWGNNYNTPDGTCIRDYIDVTDLAKAHVVALKRLLNNNGTNFEVFNLGTGNGVSVMDIIKTFEKVTGKKLNYTFADRRPGDVEKVYANTDFANSILGWKAQKSLDETLASAWKWEENYRKNPY